MKTWRIPPSAGGSGGPIETISELEALLCDQRGVSLQERNIFFDPQYADAIHDPLLLFQMQEAVDRIYSAAQKGEKILVYGDYDVDGMSSAAIVIEALREIGARCFPYLPHRTDDGYGINQKVLEELQDEFDLLISVDCGISNAAEVSWLTKKGKNAIIVDHHELPDQLPKARAVLHPRHPKGSYPWGHLSGAGVSFKLAQALLRDSRSPHANNPDKEKWLLDLAMLGTIGDVMPLLGENRAIVRFGLEVLRLGKRMGLSALADANRVALGTITADTVAFRIIPLLNAAGRVDHPQAALNLLLASKPQQARDAAENLVLLNRQRQALTRKITREAELQVDAASPVMFAANLQWPAGIVGLVAGGLARKFERPAVVVGGNGVHGVGSARAHQNGNILRALRAAEKHTLRLGGHAQAAGFSIEEERINDFYVDLCEHWQVAAKGEPVQKTQTAEAVINSELLSWDTHRLLQKFEPFGKDNPQPKFIIQNAAVVERRTVGKEGQHIKYRLALPEGEIEAIGFNLGEIASEDFTQIDVVGSLEINTFQSRRSLQLRLEDVERSGTVIIKSTS